MLDELLEDPGTADPGTADPAAVVDSYLAALADVVREVGVDRVVAESGVDEAVVAALASGDAPSLSLSDVAAILAMRDGSPDADTIRRDALDDLLFGMTTAVLDVDAVAANVDLDVSPKGVQQRLEGRTPMTLWEYAHVKSFVAGRER